MLPLASAKSAAKKNVVFGTLAEGNGRICSGIAPAAKGEPERIVSEPLGAMLKATILLSVLAA